MSSPRSFLWVSGWSVPAMVWDEQISYWPEMVHQKVDFSMCQTADDFLPTVAQTLSQVEEPVCIVAWSLGAFVTLQLLKNTTKKIHSIYLTGVGSQFIRTRNYLHGWDHRVLQRMKNQLTIDPTQVLSQFDNNLFSPSRKESRWLPLRKESHSIKALLAGLEYLEHYRFDDLVLQKHPSLFLLAGKEDRITPVEGTHHLHSQLPHSVLTVWKKTGHLPFWTEAQQFHNWIQKSISITPTN